MEARTAIAQSKRLLIRRFVTEDAKSLIPILSDNKVVSRLSISPIETIEASESYLTKIIYLNMMRPTLERSMNLVCRLIIGLLFACRRLGVSQKG